MPLLHLADLSAADLYFIPELRLERGDRAALIGPSGAGKSTLVRAILDRRRGAGYLPQEVERLLDEPTNHLDLWLREACEDALDRFPGACVVATHDRWLQTHWAGTIWPVVQ